MTQADRARRARLIMAAAWRYKVCQGCESIVHAKDAMCPHCKHYRFEDTPSLVMAQAALLGSMPQTLIPDFDDVSDDPA